MTYRLIRAWAIASVIVFTSAAFALDVPIRYIKHEGTSRTFRPYGSVQLEKLRQCPAGKWKLPKLRAKQPVFALAKLGDKERLLILDAAEGDSFYTRLYYDANADGDLTNDPVIEGHSAMNSPSSYLSSSFPSVDTYIQLGDSSLPYRFHPQAYFYGSSPSSSSAPFKDGFQGENNWNQLRFYLMVGCSYSGDFTLDAKRYQVMLGDANCNGRFDDVFSEKKYPKSAPDERHSLYSTGDQFYIAPFDGKISYNDGLNFGDRLILDGKLFNVAVSTAEARIRLTPTTDPLGTLKLSEATNYLGFHSRDGKHCYMVVGAGKEIKVPAGEYRLLEYQMTRKEDEGDLWQLCAVATTESPFTKMSGGSDGLLAFGEPFTPVVDVPKWSRDNFEGGRMNYVSLSLGIEGIAKEDVTNLSHLEGDKTKIALSNRQGYTNQPKEPSFKIAKMDGEIVTSGSFRYG